MYEHFVSLYCVCVGVCVCVCVCVCVFTHIILLASQILLLEINN